MKIKMISLIIFLLFLVSIPYILLNLLIKYNGRIDQFLGVHFLQSLGIGFLSITSIIIFATFNHKKNTHKNKSCSNDIRIRNEFYSPLKNQHSGDPGVTITKITKL